LSVFSIKNNNFFFCKQLQSLGGLINTNRNLLAVTPLPSNETARLQALNKYEILDTDTESVFDDLTRLAAYICGVPTATISLIDRDRQWLKSKIGIEVSETARDVAFCAHGILQIEPR